VHVVVVDDVEIDEDGRNADVNVNVEEESIHSAVSDE